MASDSEEIGPKDDELDEDIPADQTLQHTITLGKLARGIAHDVNNLVTSIQGNAQLATRALNNPAEVRRSLENIQLASRHITDLTAQIQAFSRTHELPVTFFDLCQVVREIEQLIRSTLPPKTELDTEIESGQIVVRGTASQISQAVMNLCANALQAIDRNENGKLTLHLFRHDEDNAQLIIQDNGHGIAKDKIEHIFDPFFTTKEYGLGSGLGLAVVHSAIDAHRGTILVESELNTYTRFTIELPIEKNADLPEASALIENASTRRINRNYAVLLVDDEPTIRSLGVDVLHSLGYRVTVARDGREALDIFSRRPEYFDLILSDSRMPEMTGMELAAEIRKRRSDIPFILITAFDDTRNNPLFHELRIADIVPKPFRIDQLQRSLSTAIKASKNNPN